MSIPPEKEKIYRMLWLFREEPWLLRRKRKRPEEEILDETEIRVLLAVSEMPGFAFLEDDKKKAVLRFGINVKSHLDSELKPVGFAKERLEIIKKQVSLALETAEEVGGEFAQRVYETAFRVVKEAWESEK